MYRDYVFLSLYGFVILTIRWQLFSYLANPGYWIVGWHIDMIE